MLSLNTNLLARTATQNLKTNYSRLAVHVQRLSTGLRVNAAADDAAGIAIRELMRADVAALHQGARNANDAISLLQTADGALAVIDEKLIRMKELAEQAATGTYDSTQRQMINNEFQAMGAEIDRIARSTDFNGIKLLDGSREGGHDGSGMDSAGALKIHFGTANDSAEDYYYVEMGDCTLAGLGLASGAPVLSGRDFAAPPPGGVITFADGTSTEINNAIPADVMDSVGQYTIPETIGMFVQDSCQFTEWTFDAGMWSGLGRLYTIPKGTKNFVFNLLPSIGTGMQNGATQEQDIQLFARNGVHLAGTPPDTDISYTIRTTSPYFDDSGGFLKAAPTDLAHYGPLMGFTETDYDGANLNTGLADYNNGNTGGAMDNASLNWTDYNGMRIGYSGDSDTDNNGDVVGKAGYEVLAIDGEVTEDLYLWITGDTDLAFYKMYWDGKELEKIPNTFPMPTIAKMGPSGVMLDIATQERAQKALGQIDDAIAVKDKVRAHIGAMQNRLENTVTNLTVQAENLQAAESRISDADVALEMTQFVRNQILTQAATAMVSQANALPQMLSGLLRA